MIFLDFSQECWNLNVCEPSEAARVLADYWRPIFSGTQIDDCGAKDFLDGLSGT